MCAKKNIKNRIINLNILFRESSIREYQQFLSNLIHPLIKNCLKMCSLLWGVKYPLANNNNGNSS